MAFVHRYGAIFILLSSLSILPQCETGNDWGDPYEEDQWALYTKNGGLSSNQIMSLKADSRGNLWVGTWDNGLMKFDGNNWTFFDERDGLPDFTVFTIEEDVNGDMLLGTFFGLSIYDGTRFNNYLFGQEYLPINDIHVSEDESLWLATEGFGLLEITNQIKPYSLISRPMSIFVFSITEDIHNVLWAGTAAGVFKIAGGRVEFLDRSNGIPRDSVTSVAADSWGDVWMGVWGAEHILRYGDEGIEEISLFIAFPDVGVNFIFEDSRGNVWFALERAGVVKYDGAVMRTYRDVDGLPSNSINCIEEDQEGNIWFGSDEHGLARFTPGNQ
jgi:ligand-binding sensor domain-containing protein